MSTTIYYFSATGNSLKVAKDLNDHLADSKIVQPKKPCLMQSLQAINKILQKKPDV